jgi:hypothetical protein
MRQKDDAPFAIALNNMAFGDMQPEDIKLLKSREISVLKEVIPPNAIYLFADRNSVKGFNEKKLNSMTTEQCMCLAFDRVLGTGNVAQRARMLEEAQDILEDKATQMQYLLNLRIEAKYMVTVNINVPDGLANGSSGVLKKITYSTDLSNKTALRLWIEFDSPDVGVLARITYASTMKSLKIPQSWTPLDRHSTIIKKAKNTPLQVQRYQFPIVPAEAITIHKSQGLTFEYVVLCLKPSYQKNLDRQSLYVGCSRATKASGLFLDGDFKAPSKMDSGCNIVINEMQRMKKISPLSFNIKFLQDIKTSELKIVFHNVQSYQKHRLDVLCDQFYTQADILLFVEVGDVSKEHLKIPGFYLCSSAFRRKKCRGYLCFVKESLMQDTRFICDNIQDMDSNVEVFIISHKNIGICGLYKAPGKTLSDVKEQLLNLKIHELIKNYENFFVFGDFNHDLNNIEKNKVGTKFISDLGLKNALGLNLSTTNDLTQIDWCLSKATNGFECGIYESYFSHHKPIWINVDSNITNRDSKITSSETKLSNMDTVINSLSDNYMSISSPSKNSIVAMESINTDDFQKDKQILKDYTQNGKLS